MENNITINNRIPQLRFSGYTGDWEEKSFDVICHTITPPLKLQSSQYSSSGKFPIVDQSQTLICGWTNDSSGLLRNAPYIIFGDHTCVLKYIDFPFIQGADGVKILGSNKKDNSKFIYQLLLSNPVKQDGYKRHFSDLKEKIFLLPPTLEEQTKIAECLSSIDEIISVEESKVESLKVHKKGLMQQLFPQPGATTPALRFPGFTGDWQFVNGDKLFEPISNKKHNSDLPILALTQDQGAVPREMINYNVVVSDKSVTGYKVVEVDDFIISLRSFQGGIEYSRYKGLCSPAYIVLRKKDKTLSSDFYRIYFKSFNYIQNLNKNLEGIRDGKMISYQQFSEIMLPLPTANEQIMIANCISSLDEVILLESQKLESLKTHKKGLMQQLFPQPVK